MHLNDWPLASHQLRHERQRRSSGDGGVEGSDHGRFAATGRRATHPVHNMSTNSSSSSSVSLSPSLVSISPGMLSGGGLSISNSSIASTASSTPGTSPCYQQQQQQPSYSNNGKQTEVSRSVMRSSIVKKVAWAGVVNETFDLGAACS